MYFGTPKTLKMKKLFFVAFVSLLALNVQAQKNKVLGKSENLTAEIAPNGKGKKLIVKVKGASGTETLEVKSVANNDLNPKDFVIKYITANGEKLCYLTWKEQITTQTKMKKEVADIIESQIWNTATKTLLVGNTQKSIYIKETKYLDKRRTATHEVEKRKKQGFEFVLNKDGSIILKTSKQQNHYAYNKSSGKFEPKKG